MTADETRAQARALYDAYRNKAAERVAAMVAEDIDWEICAPANLFPFAGRRRGRAAVLEALGGIAKEYALESYDNELILAEGDRAAVMSRVCFVSNFTGRRLAFRNANFLRFENGQLVEFREFIDSFQVAEMVLGCALTPVPA